MARRIQVDGVSPVAARPAASPVDTFVRPLDGQKLAQLGQALGQISPSVARFAGVYGQMLDEKSQNEGSLAGIAAAEKIKKDGSTLAEATRKGIIPASGNPFYMAGLKEQLGRAMADKYDGDLASYVSQHEGLQESTDLKDYDKVSADFKQKWKEQNIGDDNKANQFFDTGFGFRADAYDQRARQEFARGIEEKVLKQGNEATHQESVQAIQDAIRYGHPLSEAAASINQLVSDLTAQGRNPAMTLRSVAQAVHDAAVADPENTDGILKMLDSIKGKTGPLSTTSYGMALVDKAKTEVANTVQADYSRRAARDEAKKKAAVSTVLGQLTDALTNAGDDAHTIDLKPYREAMVKIAPEHVAMLDSLQDAFVRHTYAEDPHVADDLLVRMYTVRAGETGFVDTAEIARALAGHQISQSTFFKLNEERTKIDKAGQDKTIFKDPAFLKGYDAVGKLFANDLFDSEENRAKASSAQREFTAGYIRNFAGKTGSEFDAQKNVFISKAVGHELNDKGTSKQGDAFHKAPGPQLEGPQRANPKTVQLIDITKINAMQKELTEQAEGKRAKMSDPHIETLLMYGVKSDWASRQQFVYQQKLLWQAGQRTPNQ